MTEDDRKAAAELRNDILDANSGKLENYVETANLMYVLGENVFVFQNIWATRRNERRLGRPVLVFAGFDN
ncbi:MAG TPA: hypothetical protein VK582_13280 [Pyrinomonadaceae bacterium]|nr:hypothetical protein [Pyrinomonadaceae bacterium]